MESEDGRMDFVLPGPVLQALDRLEGAGFAAYAVGGCVRDWALGVMPHDYDVCTAALPEDMKKIFAGERTVETGLKHGTLTVVLSGMPLEITTFRVDGEYLDGRHPSSVRFASRVQEDLSRRDFTINAMAYSPREGLVDPFGGLADCQRGLIRCVGEPEKRFGEDGLRILRALRFSARLGFPIEENTARAAREERALLEKISRERVAAELTGTLLGDSAEGVLRDFPEILCAAVPEFTPLIQSDCWTHTLRALSCAPRDAYLRWAALLLEWGGGEMPRRVLRGLKLPAKLCDTVDRLTAWAKRFRRETPSVHYLLALLGPEMAEKLLSLMEADALARCSPGAEDGVLAEFDAARKELCRLLEENACYSLSQLAVNGRDMAALGLRGEEIGRTLNRLLMGVVAGELNNSREALLKAARE